MRMRNSKRGDSPQRTDCFHSGVVQQADTVPEHVAVWGADEKRTLSNCKTRNSTYTRQVWSDFFNTIMTFLLQFRNGCPALTVLPDVLTFILTNEAVLWF